MFENIGTITEQEYRESDTEWDDFVGQHPQGSVLQMTNWARHKCRFGWTSQRVWLRQDGRLVAGAQILFRSAALGLVRMAYIPHGPLVDWENEEQVRVLFSQIDLAIYERRAGLLKIEPLLWQHEMLPERWREICTRHDLHTDSDNIQPPRTLLLDIRPEPEEILKEMKQKTRYNIRLSDRKDVIVREGDAQDLPIFNQLMQTTGVRDEFGVHSAAYYRSVYELFAPREEAALLIAEFDERPLAAFMVFFAGKTAVYMYGASSNEERNRMPTYALQWAAITKAKSRGCHYYDLWGVPDEDEAQLEAQFTSRHDGLWGVYRNKRGFGGKLVRTVGAADKIYNKLVYRLYQRRRNQR
jgi:lipid II:glycine glycyltransferase (peptidoglycan interpeptide bridge formation enzyme)